MPDRPIPLPEPDAAPATGITLVRGPGASLAIRLEAHDGRAVTMTLGPAECVALACELLAEARLRVGRANWPADSISEPPVGLEPAEGTPIAPDPEIPTPASPPPGWRYPAARYSRRRSQ
jgi:hypothetical protein